MYRYVTEPYEPQVVKRHCGLMENDMRGRGRVHPGVVEHIDNAEDKCSCEWGFGHPRWGLYKFTHSLKARLVSTLEPEM